MRNVVKGYWGFACSFYFSDVSKGKLVFEVKYLVTTVPTPKYEKILKI